MNEKTNNISCRYLTIQWGEFHQSMILDKIHIQPLWITTFALKIWTCYDLKNEEIQIYVVFK